MTTPAAPIRNATIFFVARPPVLFKEGTAFGSTILNGLYFQQLTSGTRYNSHRLCRPSVSSMKELCSSILVFLFLLPAVSTLDDQTGLAEIISIFNARSTADVLVSPDYFSETDDSCILATFLDQLDHAQIAAVFILTPDTTSNFRKSTVGNGFFDRYVKAPGERAPPSSLFL